MCGNPVSGGILLERAQAANGRGGSQSGCCPVSYTGLQKPSLPSAEAARRRIDSALIGVLRKHETSRMKTRLVTLMHALANLA